MLLNFISSLLSHEILIFDCGMFVCDQCEKIRKQKGKFLGSFRVAHTASLDETDNKIMNVRCTMH